MSATSNITMTNYRLVSHFGILSAREMAKRSGEVAARFGFDPSKRLSATVRNLSKKRQSAEGVAVEVGAIVRPDCSWSMSPLAGSISAPRAEILATLRQMADSGVGVIVVSHQNSEEVGRPATASW